MKEIDRATLKIVQISLGQVKIAPADRERVMHVLAELGRLNGDLAGEMNLLLAEWLEAGGVEKTEINSEIDAVLSRLQQLLDELRAQ